MVGGPRDTGIDLFFREEAQNRTLIVQCKFLGGKSSRVNEAEVDKFFALSDYLADSEWVRQHASGAVRDVLGDPQQLYETPGELTFRYISPGAIPERLKERIKKRNAEYPQISLEVWGIQELRMFVEQADSLERTIPDSVDIQLPSGAYMRIPGPHDGIIAVLKTNTLCDLYGQHHQSLYEYNIRRHLGDNAINKQMAATIGESPQSFFYYNNGISAICTAFEIAENNVLTAKNFQIINGTQTLHALWTSGRTSDGRVLFRLTRTKSVKTERGFNADIIRYNNTQNIIKDFDFRSNDDIHWWLEKRFKDRPWPYAALPNLRYVRKRGRSGRAKRGEISIKLDDLAKIRYAWLHEPMTISRRPKSLFTSSEDDGKYASAFGNGRMVSESWSDDELEEALLAIWFHREIEKWRKAMQKTAREEAAQPRQDHMHAPASVNWLTGHRWHMLALAGVVCRSIGWKPGELLRDADRCREVFWTQFIERAWEVIEEAEKRRANERRQSWRDWRQSVTEWDRLKDEMLAERRRSAMLATVMKKMEEI